MLSRNSSAERSVPFRVEGMEESQEPVLADRSIRRLSVGEVEEKMVSRCCLYVVSCC
jgi:hypothetical protein